mmetsp:Transcript_40893/g.80689  ORF Transcript_40893/g.80689 Transcript_40893/m.80689 type:complete len:138 (-) Transcript_40893:44-457(-)
MDPDSNDALNMLDGVMEHTMQDNSRLRLNISRVHEVPHRKELEDLISSISQNCWFAGWMKDSEHYIWNMAMGEAVSRQWGVGLLSDSEVAKLRELSSKAGGWICWARWQEQPVHVPTCDWIVLHARWLRSRIGFEKE